MLSPASTIPHAVNNPRFFLLIMRLNFAASWLSLRDTIKMLRFPQPLDAAENVVS